jgi:putative Mn2+ efflux pump MntP
MRNLSPQQILIIGAAIVFGLPVVIGLIVGHFYGGRAGIFSGLLLCVLILFMAHRKIMAQARRQKNEKSDEEKDDGEER